MTTAVLSTLRHVSERKLAKLADLRERFDEQRKVILQSAEQESGQADKVRTLVNGVEEWNLKPAGASVKNVKRFLDQSRHDPSVSSTLLSQWQSELESTLNVRALKLEYASLFGRLVTEWIENPSDGISQVPREVLSLRVRSEQPHLRDFGKRRKLNSAESDTRRSSSGSESAASFEHIGRKEMYEQRKEWESYAFKEHIVDQSAVRKYLEELFGHTSQTKPLKETPLQRLQHGMKKFGVYEEAPLVGFDMQVVKLCIQELLKADLFSGSKREVLVDLQNKSTVLSEMADVLNGDIEAMHLWRWDPAPVPLHMRRQLNGKYRVFMDEEVHQAIFLQHVGSQVATHMKTVFTEFFNSEAWLQAPFRSMSRTDKAKRQYYLGSAGDESRSVRNGRRDMYAKEYFMMQLHWDTPGNAGYDDEDNVGGDYSKATIGTKQSMFRLATTEMLVNTRLYGHFTILQSDFKWFGPSLPHDTIFTVLEFLGFESKWVRFFKTFLEAPLVFTQDGPDAETHVRRRGVPMSHTLSTALAEAVLFCLDFAVNKHTQGQNLYRLHDDLWFWGQRSACATAWETMKDFADVMGLALNEEKTGCAHVTRDEDVSMEAAADDISPDSLPTGQVRWGFLLLDSHAGRWVVDKKKVDEHTEELQRQLAACSSVFAWVQAWNSYASRFFSANFGQPANCLGQQHVDMVFETFECIQRELFASMNSTNDSVTAYLRNTIRERFGVDNIPDGFFYFPNILGGLELRNPFVPLCLIRTGSLLDPAQQVDAALEEERESYVKLREKFESGNYIPPRSTSLWKPTGYNEFPSVEEFSAFPEETSHHLTRAYEKLMDLPQEDELEKTPEVRRALEALDVPADGFTQRKKVRTRKSRRGDATEASNEGWENLQPYWNWIFELYAGEIIQKFGGLSMCDSGLLPLGLVKTLQSEKVRWQG